MYVIESDKLQYILREKFPSLELTGNEDEVKIVCPFCGNPKKKCYVNLRKGYFNCFHCHAKGKSLYSLLHQQYSIIMQKRKEREIKIELPPGIISPKDSWMAMLYLKSRGFEKGDIEKWQVKYCVKGYFTKRVIFPTYMNGVLKGFVARTIDKRIKPKYRYPRGMRTGDILYNWDNVSEGKDLVLVEGVFDTISVSRAGFNVVGLLGSNLTKAQFSLLSRKRFPSFIIMLDDDAILKADKIARRLLVLASVKLAYLQGKDPGESDKERIGEIIAKAKIYNSIDGLKDSIDTFFGGKE